MKIEGKMAGFQGSRPFLGISGYSRRHRSEESESGAGLYAHFRSLVRKGIFCCARHISYIAGGEKKRGCIYLGGAAAAVFMAFFPAVSVHAEPVKIVIDPGHGGDNLGGQYGKYTEKYMTMVVANAMAEELEKYEGIEVYLTRTDDVALSLQQRADYAKEVDADFLFCLHFNMSEHHTLYGTEVWVSAFGNCYAEGKSFGDLCLNELCTLDLYNRGVKTRLNKDGIDYYGITQHCEEYRIPSAIIEHCHIDHREDAGRYETTEAMKKLGVLDATAVAKYYGLYSPTLGVDYRRFEKPKVEVPSSVVKPDTTEPVDVSVTCLRTKEETGELNLLLTGEDEDSGLLYYDYSLNGGTSYSGLQKWDIKGNELECTIKVPVTEDIALKCRVYNGYDLYAETNVVEIPALQGKEETEENTSENASGASENGAGSSLGDASVSGQTAEGQDTGMQETDESGEALEASGTVHQIDMSLYERQDAEKEKNKILLDSDDVSQFLWLAILGFLVSMLIVLMMVRALWQNKQKKARYRGRRR